MFKSKAAFAALLPLALIACSGDGQLTETGILVTRSACPAVGIPAGTGDITLFNPENSREASGIDVVAHVTNLRATCDETGEYIVSRLTFDVQARRSDARGPRQVTLPYFATVVQGGSNVVSKSVGSVVLNFQDGQLRTSASSTATGQVLRSAATLPTEIRRQITRRRKAGDPDAAIDPMANPEVRTAVQRASFEVLVGFQLTTDQLAYNATR